MHKEPYVLVEIRKQSRNPNQKGDGIGRIRRFPFSSDFASALDSHYPITLF